MRLEAYEGQTSMQTSCCICSTLEKALQKCWKYMQHPQSMQQYAWHLSLVMKQT